MITLKSKIRAYFGNIANADCLVWFLGIKLLQISSRSTCCSRRVCSTAIWLSLFLSYSRPKKSFQESQRGKFRSAVQLVTGNVRYNRSKLTTSGSNCSLRSWCFLWTSAQRQWHHQSLWSVVRQSNIDLQASTSEDASVACQCLSRSWLWLVTDKTKRRTGVDEK